MCVGRTWVELGVGQAWRPTELCMWGQAWDKKLFEQVTEC